MFDIGLNHYLAVSTIVFVAGVVTMALKRNAIGILIGAELVLNAAALNFVAFGRYGAGGLALDMPSRAACQGLDGQIAAVFVIVLAAAEAAMALAIFLNFYHAHGTIDVDRGVALKG